MRLYIGNLSYETDENKIKQLLEEYGKVEDIFLIKDKFTGISKGFGFVDMDNQTAQKVIDNLDGKELDGRTIKINEALPRD